MVKEVKIVIVGEVPNWADEKQIKDMTMAELCGVINWVEVKSVEEVKHK